MPRLKLKSNGVVNLYSKSRKGKVYWFQQKYTGGSIWLDDRKVCTTAKGKWYEIHLINGKFDHFLVCEPNEVFLEDFTASDESCPEDWCEECLKFSDEEYDGFSESRLAE